MSSKHFQCFVCFNDYDLKVHLPRILPGCGHTLCTKCIKRLLASKGPCCPLDKELFSKSHTKIEAFPINFTVRQVIEENLGWETCPDHGEKIKLICCEDKCKVCAYCVVYNGHRNHTIKPIMDVKEEIDKKREKLEAVMESWKGFETEMEKFFRDSEAGVIKGVEAQFKKLEDVIKLRKDQLVCEVRRYFAREKQRSGFILGKRSLWQRNLAEKIEEYKNFTKNPELFKLLDEDITQILTFSYNKLPNEADEMAELEKDIVNGCLKSLESSFREIVASLNKLKAPSGLMENIYYPFSGEGKSFVIESMLELKYLRGIQIIGQVNNLITLKINLNGTSITDAFFETFSRTLKGLEFLENLYIDLGRTQASENQIMKLFDSLSLKKELKTLDMDLSETNISNKGLEIFATKVLPNLESLTSLTMSLWNTEIEDAAASLLFLHLNPNLKQINLSLKSTYASDQSIRLFLDDIIPKMKNLVKLDLTLSQTKVNEDVIEEVKRVMEKINARFEIEKEKEESQEEPWIFIKGTQNYESDEP